MAIYLKCGISGKIQNALFEFNLIANRQNITIAWHGYWLFWER